VRQRPDGLARLWFYGYSDHSPEIFMYIGLGTVLVILLIVYFFRRV